MPCIYDMLSESHLAEIIQQLPTITMMVSEGIVEGRNVWKNDLRRSKAQIDRLREMIGDDRLYQFPA